MKEQTYNLKIESNVNTTLSVSKRVYFLKVHNVLEDGKIIASFHKEDYVPSGYRDGGSEEFFFQNQVIKMNILEINKCIAKLALKYDTELLSSNEKSRKNIFDSLTQYSKDKKKVIEV